MNTPYSTNCSSYSTLGFAYFSSGDDPKLESRCEMELDAAHRGLDELADALDALEALKQRMGDVFTEKAYQQRRKGLLKAALRDAKVAVKLEKGGGDTPSSAPQKLSWTLINSAVGNGHDWESAFASLPFEIISGEWKSDRASPTSQVGGQEARRRCCDVDGTRYYARLVKNPKGQFALFQGNPKDASEGEDPHAKEEAKAVKEVRPLTASTAAHCSRKPTARCPHMPAQPAAAHIMHSSQFMLSSHVCPSFSHCYIPLPAGQEEEDEQGRRKKGRRQGGTKGRE